MKHLDANGDAYSIDLDYLTVIIHHAGGGVDDLNALGCPCESAADLREFIHALEDQGAFTVSTRDALLADCPTTTPARAF